MTDLEKKAAQMIENYRFSKQTELECARAIINLVAGDILKWLQDERIAGDATTLAFEAEFLAHPELTNSPAAAVPSRRT